MDIHTMAIKIWKDWITANRTLTMLGLYETNNFILYGNMYEDDRANLTVIIISNRYLDTVY